MCWGCPVSDGQERRLFVARALLKGARCLPVGCWGTKLLALSTALADSELSRSSDCRCEQWTRGALKVCFFSPDFFPYPLADHWVSSLHIRMAVLSQPDGPIAPFPQNILLAVSKLIWALLGAFYLNSTDNLPWISILKFLVEASMHSAFPVAGTQSSITRWGKYSLLFTSALLPAFVWYPAVLLVEEMVSDCRFSTFSTHSCLSRLLLLPPLLSPNPYLQSSCWYLLYLDPWGTW